MYAEGQSLVTPFLLLHATPNCNTVQRTSTVSISSLKIFHCCWPHISNSSYKNHKFIGVTCFWWNESCWEKACGLSEDNNMYLPSSARFIGCLCSPTLLGNCMVSLSLTSMNCKHSPVSLSPGQLWAFPERPQETHMQQLNAIPRSHRLRWSKRCLFPNLSQ